MGRRTDGFADIRKGTDSAESSALKYLMKKEVCFIRWLE